MQFQTRSYLYNIHVNTNINIAGCTNHKMQRADVYSLMHTFLIWEFAFSLEKENEPDISYPSLQISFKETWFSPLFSSCSVRHERLFSYTRS